MSLIAIASVFINNASVCKDTNISSTNLIVNVDFNSSNGEVRDLFGVNKTPVINDTQALNANTYNLASVFSSFGISSMRFHDSGLDICDIYKDADITDLSSGTSVAQTSCTSSGSATRQLKWTVKNPATIDSVSNYNFTALDAAISAATGSGGKVYLRLGHNYNGVNNTGDPVSWAKVATNVYKHIIGTFAPSSVKTDPVYVEVFNEPDGMFWVGTKDDFFSLFNNTIDGVRAAAQTAGKTVTIGGPGFTSEYLTKTNISSKVANGFVAGVTAERLDFFSVHRYGDCSSTILSAEEKFFSDVRSQIDLQGLTGKPMHITEWNIGLGSKCGESFFDEQRIQSYASSLLTIMQNPTFNIQTSHFYSGMIPMSLFAFDATQAGKVIVRPSSWSIWAHSKLKGGNLYKTQVCNNNVCVDGFSSSNALMTLSAKVSGKSYTIVTNDSDTAYSFTLRVKSDPKFTQANVYSPPIALESLLATKSNNVYSVDSATIQTLINKITPKNIATSSCGDTRDFNLTIGARTFALVELL